MSKNLKVYVSKSQVLNKKLENSTLCGKLVDVSLDQYDDESEDLVRKSNFNLICIHIH
jgi:hypothetical protein